MRASARRRLAGFGSVSRQRRSSASARSAQSRLNSAQRYMRHYVDTAKHIAAERGEDTTNPG